jgi:alkanesulfonate monooxygenase SsuD/methylene tetrahydromethanopterin reductase-like flavin-dependent oxidoreductase (luciferase family)
VAGKATRLDDQPDGPTVQLAPAASVPPILVGGMSDAALARAVEFGDGWFALPGSPEGLREARERLAALATDRGRTPPQVTTGLMTAISGDPDLPDRDALVRMLTDPDGVFGMPEDQAPALVATGGPAEIADRLAAYAGAGAARVVVTVAAGDWRRQTDLLAEAHALLT